MSGIGSQNVVTVGLGSVPILEHLTKTCNPTTVKVRCNRIMMQGQNFIFRFSGQSEKLFIDTSCSLRCCKFRECFFFSCWTLYSNYEQRLLTNTQIYVIHGLLILNYGFCVAEISSIITNYSQVSLYYNFMFIVIILCFDIQKYHNYVEYLYCY